MMRLTPIIKKDMEIRSRSLACPLVITVLNAVLFIIGLSGSYGIISGMRHSLSANGRSFLNLYAVVAVLEYIILLFACPLYTAASVSGEKETGTFDLLVTTSLSPAEIIIEKLASAFLIVLILLCSAFPAMLVPLMYGGVSIQSTILLMAVMAAELMVVMCAGMFASTVCSTSVRSIAAAYAFTAGIVAGPVIISMLAGALHTNENNRLAYLTVIDPLLPMLSLLAKQLGQSGLIRGFYEAVKLDAGDVFLRLVIPVSLAVQLLMAAGFVVMSIINIMPGHLKFRNFNSDKHS